MAYNEDIEHRANPRPDEELDATVPYEVEINSSEDEADLPRSSAQDPQQPSHDRPDQHEYGQRQQQQQQQQQQREEQDRSQSHSTPTEGSSTLSYSTHTNSTLNASAEGTLSSGAARSQHSSSGHDNSSSSAEHSYTQNTVQSSDSTSSGSNLVEHSQTKYLLNHERHEASSRAPNKQKKLLFRDHSALSSKYSHRGVSTFNDAMEIDGPNYRRSYSDMRDYVSEYPIQDYHDRAHLARCLAPAERVYLQTTHRINSSSSKQLSGEKKPIHEWGTIHKSHSFQHDQDRSTLSAGSTAGSAAEHTSIPSFEDYEREIAHNMGLSSTPLRPDTIYDVVESSVPHQDLMFMDEMEEEQEETAIAATATASAAIQDAHDSVIPARPAAHIQQAAIPPDTSNASREMVSAGRYVFRRESRTKRNTMDTYSVLFSDLEPAMEQRYTKFLRQLGCRVVYSWQDCTFAVAREQTRTVKLLLTVASKKPVVNHTWIQESIAAQRLLDYNDYILHEPSEQNILEGKHVWFSPSCMAVLTKASIRDIGKAARCKILLNPSRDDTALVMAIVEDDDGPDQRAWADQSMTRSELVKHFLS
ncbi:hypothetical protein BCR43DRAFT_482883 [Syncephalastrum racemosum]|uniref:BRCT domain-containing protein n=1 Tax=Syncephalastrum racemosum TaxID=13706 RepID=A0A1X2HUB0_SYNRA|nr:hypothetical protein BCR43DRAFT_482883 [Syncephalastrum racemosum]